MRKSVKICVWAFIIMAVADLSSTIWFRLSSGHLLLESNPLYLITGSFAAIVAANVFAVIFYAWWGNRLKDPRSLFVYVASVGWITYIRIAVVASNVILALDPPSEAQVQAFIDGAAVAGGFKMTLLFGYLQTVAFLYVLPLSVTLLVYFVYKMDVRQMVK